MTTGGGSVLPMRTTLLAASLAVLLSTPAWAAELTVDGGFSRVTPGTGPGVAYVTIHGGDVADRLVKVSSPRAPTVEMHTMTMEGSIMRMREVEAIDVPAGATVRLAPGGMHLMLTGMAAPLKVGETLTLVLTFEHAGTRSINVPVEPLGSMGPMAPMPGMGRAP